MLSSLWSSELDRAVLTVHANVAIYSFCFWFTQPVMPYLSQSLGAGEYSRHS